MANMAAKMTAAFFDSLGMKYDIAGKDGEAIMTGFAMKNKDGIKILIIFDEDEGSASLRTFDSVTKFPEDKKSDMYKLVNELNCKFRWIKFTVDEEENCINAEDDAIIQLDSCGKEIFECCGHFCGIIDTAYPEIMKAIFA